MRLTHYFNWPTCVPIIQQATNPFIKLSSVNLLLAWNIAPAIKPFLCGREILKFSSKILTPSAWESNAHKCRYYWRENLADITKLSLVVLKIGRLLWDSQVDPHVTSRALEQGISSRGVAKEKSQLVLWKLEEGPKPHTTERSLRTSGHWRIPVYPSLSTKGTELSLRTA
jgi:hypothetical protein